MSYVRIETSVPRHPKFLRAGGEACWLWLCGVAYCQDALTDGFIADEALSTLGMPKPLPLAHKLVAVGLWHKVDGGWRVHDYLDHNNSAEYIRRVQKARREAGRHGGRPVKHNGTNVLNQFAFDVLFQSAKQIENPSVQIAVQVPVSVQEQEQERAPGALTKPKSVGEDVAEMIRWHRRQRSRETGDGKPPIRVMAALVRHLLEAEPRLNEFELKDRIKHACVRANLDYSAPGIVANAIDRARAQLHKRVG